MELTKTQRDRIFDAVKENRKNYDSDAKHATALGLSKAYYSSIKNGETERVSTATLVTLARRLNVSLRSEMEWKAAETPVYTYITQQLEYCQQSSLSGLLCDVPNIGKTFTAKAYVRTHKNAIYVDCGQVKTKMRMIRHIAKEFGVNFNGRYADVYDDLVYYLKSIERPLIILDEAGDIAYETFEELKALWNATEHCCGWFMMGANGLKKKIRSGMERETNSYEEMFSRYGGKFNRITPEDMKERAKFLEAQSYMIAKLNRPTGCDIRQIINRAGGNLRRVYTEIEKEVLNGKED
ncbi:AAA family ATPase [Phocaeicola faecicola]|jgi:DNA transposition AAA+ family ATPase|uniref:AAA family ATPase n=1 Tax=Phocaeicola faecicola TaxID=2739389 RepID=UPI0015E73054|nr:AAA family ATPase [Phocaeicola faecicola]